MQLQAKINKNFQFDQTNCEQILQSPYLEQFQNSVAKKIPSDFRQCYFIYANQQSSGYNYSTPALDNLQDFPSSKNSELSNPQNLENQQQSLSVQQEDMSDFHISDNCVQENVSSYQEHMSFEDIFKNELDLIDFQQKFNLSLPQQQQNQQQQQEQQQVEQNMNQFEQYQKEQIFNLEEQTDLEIQQQQNLSFKSINNLITESQMKDWVEMLTQRQSVHYKKFKEGQKSNSFYLNPYKAKDLAFSQQFTQYVIRHVLLKEIYPESQFQERKKMHMELQKTVILSKQQNSFSPSLSSYNKANNNDSQSRGVDSIQLFRYIIENLYQNNSRLINNLVAKLIEEIYKEDVTVRDLGRRIAAFISIELICQLFPQQQVSEQYTIPYLSGTVPNNIYKIFFVKK